MSPETNTQTAVNLLAAPGRESSLPEWVATTDRNALPEVLDWASDAARPPINGRVDVVSHGFALGTGTVVGYFHRSNELGCKVELDSVPAHLVELLPADTSVAHFFGEELTRLDQGDAPEDAGVDNAGVLDKPFVKAEQPQEVPTAETEPETVETDEAETTETSELLADEHLEDDELGDHDKVELK